MRCGPPGGVCQALQGFDTERDFEFEFIAPDPDEQFRVQLGAHGYLFARPALGSAFSSKTQFEVLSAEAGVKQTLDLATISGQVDDSDYASSFQLTAPLAIGAGESVTEAVERLGKLLGTDLDLDLDLVAEEPTLAESPKGTFTVTPASVEPGSEDELGEMATFEIELDPVTYLGLESVEKVEIFWRHDGDDGEFTLTPGRPSCSDIGGGSGKTTFTCTTDFLEEHRGEQTFYAFVHVRFFGVPLPIPLEISEDAHAKVRVGEGECPTPPDWAVAEIVDNSEVSEGAGEGSVELSVDYNHVSATIRSGSDEDGGVWAPDVYLDVNLTDYLKVIPLNGWPSTGEVTLVVQATGSGQASRERAWGSNGLCYGDEAEIEAYLLGQLLDVKPPCGELTGSAELDEVHDWWTFSEWRSDWQKVSGYLGGRVRTGGAEAKSEASLELSVRVLRAVDSAGEEIPVRVCSASGTQY